METQTNTQIFNFYKDEKCTIWTRERFEIKAETYEQAVQMVKEMEKDLLKYDGIQVSWEELPETLETLSVEDNNGLNTIEIVSEDTDEIIYENGDKSLYQ